MHDCTAYIYIPNSELHGQYTAMYHFDIVTAQSIIKIYKKLVCYQELIVCV